MSLHKVTWPCTKYITLRKAHVPAQSYMTVHKIIRPSTKFHDPAQNCTTLQKVTWPFTRLHDPAQSYMPLRRLHDLAQSYMPLQKVTRPCTKLHDPAQGYTTLHKVAWPCTRLHDPAQSYMTLHKVHNPASIRSHICNVNVNYCKLFDYLRWTLAVHFLVSKHINIFVVSWINSSLLIGDKAFLAVLRVFLPTGRASTQNAVDYFVTFLASVSSLVSWDASIEWRDQLLRIAANNLGD